MRKDGFFAMLGITQQEGQRPRSAMLTLDGAQGKNPVPAGNVSTPIGGNIDNAPE